MGLCTLCGMQLGGAATLCAHHDQLVSGWAAQNRIMCDLLHRGVVPPRLPTVERLDDFVVAVDAA
jgi:hypothetical protein